MKYISIAATIGATLALQASGVSAKHSHFHPNNVLDRRHLHHAREAQTSKAETGPLELRDSSVEVEKRGGQCQFPSDAGLVAITPGAKNAGWAMSPDQPCVPGSYCPYACPPGQMMAQWDPSATSYTYPQSMNGGLYCDKSGNVKKPFPDKPYCMGGSSNIGAVNKAGKVVSFCQTVLPGNEAMLIPTSVEDMEKLTVPGPDYWCGTAAHFYINPPGVDTKTACVWGSKDNPWGNWSPYVAGGNTDHQGNTFIKLAWNPIYLEPATPFRTTMPTWGVEVVCDKPGCNGLPCAVDPAKHKVNEMDGTNTDGAGGGSFCVVTVPPHVNANFVVFDRSSGSAGSGSGSGPTQSAKRSDTPTPTAAPTSSSSSSPSAAPSSSTGKASSSATPASSVMSSSSGTAVSTVNSRPSASASFAYSPHVLLQNVTSSLGTASSAFLSVQTTLPIVASSESGSGSPMTPSVSQIAAPTGTSAGYRSQVTAAGFSLGLLAAVMAFAF